MHNILNKKNACKMENFTHLFQSEWWLIVIPLNRFVHMLSVFLKELMMKNFSVTYFNWFRLLDLSALINLAFLNSS
jgi:hypothetical protein